MEKISDLPFTSVGNDKLQSLKNLTNAFLDKINIQVEAIVTASNADPLNLEYPNKLVEINNYLHEFEEEQ